MTHFHRTTHSSRETEALGFLIGAQLPDRVVVTLTGPLGSGKTTFLRGLVSARSTDPVSSPTFVYHQRYTVNCKPRTVNGQSSGDPLNVIDHVDLYRVHGDSFLRTRSGVDELLTDVPGWLLIEWPLAELSYPTDVPILHIVASGAPTFTFQGAASWPLQLDEEAKGRR